MADSSVQVVPFLTPSEFVQLSEQMRDLGVMQFSYAGVTVRFAKGQMVPTPRTIEKDEPMPVDPHKLQGPDLYRQVFGGKLPSFPGGDK